MNDIDLYHKIKSFKDYTPNPDVNEAFSELVKYSLNDKNEIHLTDTEILDLQNICSNAEEKLELHFANSILSRERKLEDFLYYTNYCEQVNLEMSFINKISPNIKNILFIGGGALPMTAILLSSKFGFNCDVIEKDENYAKISKKLIDNLSIKNINIINTEALDYGGYANYDLIIVSALTNSDVMKKEMLINHISSRAPLVLTRYATGNKVLLYPDLDKSVINNIASTVIPTGNIINSALIIKN